MIRARGPARAALAVVAAVALAGLAGCGGGSDEGNAPVLWLALDGRETEVRLIDYEPPPY